MNKPVTWRRSHFGTWADYDAPGCNVVVVCVNGGRHMQLHPVALRLLHQIYKTECAQWLKEHGATEIVLVPADSKNYLTVMEKKP